MKIYLCGPINGCNDSECKDWREYVKSIFPESIDPMRRDYRGKELTLYKEIVELDKDDILHCDVVLANCPYPSVGTSMEIFFAWSNFIPVCAVVPDVSKVSPWLKYHATEVFESLEAVIKQLKGRYENQ